MADGINRAGTKTAFNELLDAIEALKDIEGQEAVADAEDRAILAKFCGFGAFATTAFPNPATGEYAKGWKSLGEELRDVLTDEEYESARRTTFSAFYTSPMVMSEMHRALARMGIGVGSRGLEPGCGIGNFIGAAPSGLEFIIGVEQDSLSGRIARLIHPEHDIRIEGFQDSNLPEGSVDFAIGNVPFADIKIRHNGGRHSLHDFFFLKSLDAVRPGGALALVTSRYTLDKADPAVRELLAEQADFVGAVRLPGEAFRDQGTGVVTDVIFLRKRPREQEAAPEWADWWLTASTATLEGGEATINDYFAANPHMVLGEMSVGQGMYNGQTLRVRSDGELAAALHAAVDGLPEGICTPRTTPLATLPSLEMDPDLPEYVVEGSFFIAEGKKIMQVVGGNAEPVMMRDKPLMANGTPGGKRLGALIELKQRARHVLATQQEGRPDNVKEAARRHLRSAYTRFVSRYGPINKTTLSERKDGAIVRRMPNVLRFRSDPDVYLVMALEQYDERTSTAKPAAIMERDVVAAAEAIGSVENAKDGLLASLNGRGCVDVPYIASLYGRTELEVIEELGQLIFFDPILESHVPADEYLSGDVREKLRLARSSEDPRTRGNAAALEKVQPEDLVADEIDVTLGTPWIPEKDVQRFLSETLGIAPSSVSVEYVQKEALWKVSPSTGYRGSAVATSEFGTEDVDAFTLVEQALNMRSPTVQRRIPGGPGESDTYVMDQEATLAAREKQSELKHKFSGWAFEDAERSERLVRFYNENFNNLRLREFSGAHLTFPRMSSAITMREHQKDAIWRNMSSGNTLYAHVVGAGKTFTMVASGMEMRRTGLAKKPLYVVPNHMLEQFSREFLVLYPDANILVATKKDLAKSGRQLLKSRMATGDWDGIVMTHSSFEKMAMSPDFQARFLADQIAEYEELLVGVTDRSLTGNLTKKVEKMKAARQEKLKEMGGTKDGGLFFDELGIDEVFVDEAHMYKNLETPTKMDRVAGIQTGGSNRAFDLLMKARYLESRTPGRGLTFATGTPISNSLGEMYTMMRYLMPDLLRERGIEHFDAWAAAFGEVINSLEVSPDGQSLRVNSRFAKFKNLPELLTLFRLSADVQTGAMLDLPTPALVGGKAEIVAAPMSDCQVDFQSELVDRYERVRGGGVDPHDDNALKIITDGRKLALDARLVDETAEDDPQSKLNLLVDKVYEIWERTADQKSAQMIFSDLGVSEADWGFCVYDEIMDKLEARGIPRDEIANIGDAGTDQKKEALFSTVRTGQVRVLLGSTTKMGTGTNVQAKLYALHHVDPPWRPADIEQREGRILRQGNTNPEVEIYRYVTEGSFDAFMWQTLETKAKFISQAMMGDVGTRRADDIGGAELSFAEVKAIATGNPAMLVLAEMDLDLRQLTLLRNAHNRDQAKISANLQLLPQDIELRDNRIAELQRDIESRQDTKGDAFVMQVGERVFKAEKGQKSSARMRAQDALALAVAKTHADLVGTPMPWSRKVGQLGGLDVVLKAEAHFLTKDDVLSLAIEGAASYDVGRIENAKKCPALVQSMESALRGLDKRLAEHRGVRQRMTTDLEHFQERSDMRFASEDVYQELRPLRARLKKLLSRQDVEATKEVTATAAEAGPSASEEIRSIIDAYRGLSVHDEQPARGVQEVAEVGEDLAGTPSEPAPGVPTRAELAAPVSGNPAEEDVTAAEADDVVQTGQHVGQLTEDVTTAAADDEAEAGTGDRRVADVAPGAAVPEPIEEPHHQVDALDLEQEGADREHEGLMALERELAAESAPAPADAPLTVVAVADEPQDRHLADEDLVVDDVVTEREEALDLEQEAADREHEGLMALERELAAESAPAPAAPADAPLDPVTVVAAAEAAETDEVWEPWPHLGEELDPIEHLAGSYIDSPDLEPPAKAAPAEESAGQIRLFKAAQPAPSPRVTRATRTLIQMNLFDTPVAEKPAPRVVEVRSLRPAAWEVRQKQEEAMEDKIANGFDAGGGAPRESNGDWFNRMLRENPVRVSADAASAIERIERGGVLKREGR